MGSQLAGEKDNPSGSVIPRAAGRTLWLRQGKGSLEPELPWGELGRGDPACSLQLRAGMAPSVSCSCYVRDSISQAFPFASFALCPEQEEFY